MLASPLDYGAQVVLLQGAMVDNPLACLKTGLLGWDFTTRKGPSAK
jgi:hypothetical protein